MGSTDKKMEIDDYLDRCSGLSPQEKLRKLGELRDFFFKHMTPEGKRAFLESRGVVGSGVWEGADKGDEKTQGTESEDQ